MDDNSSKTTSINNRDNNTISMDKHESLSFTSKSNELEDSEKEIKGFRFYSKDKRYIFMDLYSKEIDGVYILYTKFLMTFIEFKKSMNTLLDLLNQIKDISKVVGNLGDDELPTLIIGIICRYSVNQITKQNFLLE